MTEKLPKTDQRTGKGNPQNKSEYPKWWNPRWWVVLGLIVFIVAVVSLLIATRYYVGHPNDTPAFVAGVIGLLTLYAIALQIFVSRMQWAAMQEQRDIMQGQLRAMETSGRPVLGVDRIRLKEEKSRDKTPNGDARVILEVKNTGKGAALNVTAKFLARLYTFGEIDEAYPTPETMELQALPEDFEDRLVDGAVISPKTFMTYTATFPTAFETIRNGKLVLMVYLGLTYQQVDGTTFRLTGFWRYEPDFNFFGIARSDRHHGAT